MAGSVVYDFDGTLVLENSTRVLEELMFARYRGRLRRPVRWVFFGPGRRGVNAASSAVGVITGRRIDWRFVAFLRVMGEQSPECLAAACDDTAARLTLNEPSLRWPAPATPISVASCGLAPVIEAFLRRARLDAEVMTASQIAVAPSGRARARLVEPRVKSVALQAVPGLHFVTDDRAEAHVIATDYARGRTETVDVLARNGLYHVVARTSVETAPPRTDTRC